jgi:hypothetical protein
VGPQRSPGLLQSDFGKVSLAIHPMERREEGKERHNRVRIGWKVVFR